MQDGNNDRHKHQSRIEVERIMEKEGFTQTQLAKLVGMKGQSNVSEALKRDLRYSLFQKMVESMGYEIVIQKKKPGRKSVRVGE